MYKISEAQEPKKILKRGLGIKMDTTKKVSKVRKANKEVWKELASEGIKS